MITPKTKEPGLSLMRPKFGQDFFKQAYAELRRVRWPTKQQATRLTLIVIAASVAVGAYIGALDFGFTKLMTILLK